MSAYPPRLRGVVAPVSTPFNADLSPAAPRFIQHCRSLLGQGAGLAVFGTTSEANSLTVNEKHALLDALLDAGLPPQMMMPGTGTCALPDTIELTRHAVASGCAGVLMLPPFYYKGVSDEGLFRSYARVIEGVADPRLRIYLYHIPPVAQVSISLPLISRLLKTFPGIIAGIKDSSGDWNNTAAMLDEFRAQEFDVFCGSESFLLQTLRGGGAGCITATANVNAAAIARLCAQWQTADADAQQVALNRLRGVFQKLPMIAALKAALAWKSGDETWSIVRPPLVELGQVPRTQLEADLTAIGFELAGAAADSQR